MYRYRRISKYENYDPIGKAFNEVKREMTELQRYISRYDGDVGTDRDSYNKLIEQFIEAKKTCL